MIAGVSLHLDIVKAAGFPEGREIAANGCFVEDITNFALDRGFEHLWTDILRAAELDRLDHFGNRRGLRLIVGRYPEKGRVRGNPADAGQLVTSRAKPRIGTSALDQEIQGGREPALAGAAKLAVIADGTLRNGGGDASTASQDAIHGGGPQILDHVRRVGLVVQDEVLVLTWRTSTPASAPAFRRLALRKELLQRIEPVSHAGHRIAT